MARTQAGGRFVARSYARLEVVSDRSMGAHVTSMLRHVEPLLLRAGILHPVWVEIEPGVTLKLDPRDLVSRSILASLHTRWEPQIWEALSARLSPGAVFLDIGAHIGYYTLKASPRVGSQGRVIAFEPNPRTVALLGEHVSVNHASNVVVEPIACTDTEQMLTLFDATDEGNSGASSLSSRNAQSSAGTTVKGRPIDDVVSELGLNRVDLMKIDVEGAELIVLRGAIKTLRRFGPTLVLEVSPSLLRNMGTSAGELEAFLTSAGYSRSRILDDTDQEWAPTVKNSTAARRPAE
jgi:FkbM family methyltransferase